LAETFCVRDILQGSIANRIALGPIFDEYKKVCYVPVFACYRDFFLF
jgi:hypothetical protein